MALLTKVGTLAIPANGTAANTLQAVTGVGFRPWLVLAWTTGSAAASDAWAAGYYAMFGFAASAAAADQGVISASSQNGVTTTATSRQHAAALISIIDFPGTNTLVRTTLESFDADGFTMRHQTVTSTLAGTTISYLCLGSSGTEDYQAKVVTWDLPAAAGLQTVAGVGFTPDMLIHIGALATAGTALPQSFVNAHFAVGFANAQGQEASLAFASQGAVVGSNTSRYQQTDASHVGISSGEALLHQFHHEAMTSDGFTVRHSNVNARRVQTLAIRGITSEIGSVTKTDDAAPAPMLFDRFDFRPRAVLLSNVVDGPHANVPFPSAYWQIGATDGVTHNSHTLGDNDAVATTVVNSKYTSGTPLQLVASAGGADSARATAVALNADDLTLTMNPNGSGRHDVLYVALGDGPAIRSIPATVSPGWPTDTPINGQARPVLDRAPDGTLWTVAFDGTGAAYLYYSLDAGRTWNTPASGSNVVTGVNRDQYSFFIDSQGWFHLAYLTTAATSTIAYRRGVPVGRTGVTWGAEIVVVSDTNVNSAPDVVAFRDGDSILVALVYSLRNGAPNSLVQLARYRYLLTQGAATDTPTAIGTVAAVPSTNIAADLNGTIEFRHTGDGKTPHPSGPNLYVGYSFETYGAGRGIRVSRATYTAGSGTTYGTLGGFPAAGTAVDENMRANSGVTGGITALTATTVRYQPGTEGGFTDRIILGGWGYAGGALAANHTACLYHANEDTTGLSTLIASPTSSTGRQAHFANVVAFPNGDCGLISSADSPAGIYLWRAVRNVAFVLATHRRYIAAAVYSAGTRISAMRGHQNRGGPSWIYQRGNQSPVSAFTVVYDDLNVLRRKRGPSIII